ncbi:hypothetical protein IC235_11135 [Hymenobacter sp. BT664]|uniref:Uncharacterized protein n=1 Tax=Hymenobacter montanus TaxID=2771359 RepID=A0A927GJF7_9BACT|nr:hypothetical protein [Hymenobacter montanus]MBD2768443.1 hypothetical protein [Hymenobacter montanus]
MKLPALQFYPGDWHKDQGVQALSLEERGAWFELLLMMHDSDERGVLLVNGKPMPEAVIARRLGLVNQTANQILTTLLEFGVASKRESDGAVFCRRMVKDEKLRLLRTEAGRKGGNPNLLNQKSKQKPTTVVKQKSTPSSSFTTSVNRERGTAKAAPPAPQTSGLEKHPNVGKKKGTALARPTLAEIEAYAESEHGAEARAEAAPFFDHFESNGWRVAGKTPMVNWQASFRNWLRRRPQFAPAATTGRAGAGPAATPTRARSAPKPNDPKRYS